MMTILNSIGILVIGILCGELIHRILMLVERVSKLAVTDDWMSLLPSIFSNCHEQAVKILILLFLGVYFVNTFERHTVADILGVAIIYALLRTSGAMENSFDDINILKKNNALPGPGLAVNYWHSYLKYIVTDNPDGCIKDLLDSVLDKGERHHQDVAIEGNILSSRLSAVRPVVHSAYDKVIILMPSSCRLNVTSQESLRNQNVFLLCHDEAKGKDPCECRFACICCHRKCKHTFYIKRERKNDIKLTVYWIYEREEDERKMAKNANKIFIMFDFPTLLQSAMGPGTVWDEANDARALNVKEFKNVLKNYLVKSEDSRSPGRVNLYDYCDNKEGGKKKLLSSMLRQRILQDPRNICAIRN